MYEFIYIFYRGTYTRNKHRLEFINVFFYKNKVPFPQLLSVVYFL